MNRQTTHHKGILLDLMIYLTIMFLIREITLRNTHFLVTGLFWSFTCLIIARWRMKVRGVTWKDLGLTKPKSIKKTLLVTALILVLIIICLMAFNIIKYQIPYFSEQTLEPENTSPNAPSKFGNLKGNWMLLFTIIPMVLMESFLEELLDRGFFNELV